MINARKKLIFGILERSGQPGLGFDPTATTPEATLFRTVLVNTGLYRKSKSDWRWSKPSEVKDVGLAEIWRILENFFTASGNSKEFSKLVEELTSSPYGVRKGLIPILVASGLQAFGKAVAIRHQTEYLPDILPSQIESICSSPKDYSVQVLQLDRKTKNYFEELIIQFTSESIDVQGDVIRQFHDAITAWKASLPETVFRVRKISKLASAFQRVIKTESDPVELALVEFPKLVGTKKGDYKAVVEAVRFARRELESIVDRYTRKAISVIQEVFSVNLNNSSDDSLHSAKEWSECIGEGLLSNGVLEPIERAILSKASNATGDRFTDAFFARAVSTIVLGKGPEDWDDRSAIQFESKLKEIVSRIEMLALESDQPGVVVAPLLKHRIQHLYGKLDSVLGQEQAQAFLNNLGNDSSSSHSEIGPLFANSRRK